MKKYFKHYFFISILLFLSCCTTQLPSIEKQHITFAQDKWKDVDEIKLQKGRTLFVSRCSSCHSLPLPSSQKETEWEKILDHMKHRAKIDKMEIDLILKYIFTIKAFEVMENK